MRLLSKKMRVVFNWKLLPIQRLLSNVRLRPAKGILSNIELLFFLNHKLLPNQGLWINMGLWEAKVLLSNMGLVPKSKKWYYTKLRISVLLSTPCSSWQGFFFQPQARHPLSWKRLHFTDNLPSQYFLPHPILSYYYSLSLLNMEKCFIGCSQQHDDYSDDWSTCWVVIDKNETCILTKHYKVKYIIRSFFSFWCLIVIFRNIIAYILGLALSNQLLDCKV